MISRRNILAATAASGLTTAATTALAASFGNPDQPPQGAINAQGNPSSFSDPGPQNPVIGGQFPSAQSPPPTDVGNMPMF
jgi:oxalate decarboxylase